MKSLTTRYLMTCAAIGAAGGVLLVPINHIAAAAVVLPLLYAPLVGFWILPVVVALALLRRPLAGVLTSLIAGLITIPFQPYGASAVITTVMVGVAIELFFAITLYRVWRWWLFALAAVLMGALYSYTAYISFDIAAMGVWMAVAFYVLMIGSSLGFTLLGLSVAKRLTAAGVARGLAPKAVSREVPQRAR